MAAGHCAGNASLISNVSSRWAVFSDSHSACCVCCQTSRCQGWGGLRRPVGILQVEPNNKRATESLSCSNIRILGYTDTPLQGEVTACGVCWREPPKRDRSAAVAQSSRVRVVSLSGFLSDSTSHRSKVQTGISSHQVVPCLQGSLTAHPQQNQPCNRRPQSLVPNLEWST